MSKRFELPCSECGQPAGFTDTIYGWPRYRANEVCADCVGESKDEQLWAACERALTMPLHIPGKKYQ